MQFQKSKIGHIRGSDFGSPKLVGKNNVAGRAKDGDRMIQSWNRKSFKCLQFSFHTFRGLILKKIIY